jgi:hypothetical protein
LAFYCKSAWSNRSAELDLGKMPNEAPDYQYEPAGAQPGGNSPSLPPAHRKAELFARAIQRHYDLCRGGDYLERGAEEVEALRRGIRDAWAWAESAKTPHMVSEASKTKSSDQQPSWMYRATDGSTFGEPETATRGSLNIKVTPEILQELEKLLAAGEVQFQYKFGNPSIGGSLIRHDTVTIFFLSDPPAKTLRSVAEFAYRHGRKPAGAAKWDDQLFGENIIVDGEPLAGFRVDRAGTVKDAHVEPFVRMLQRVQPELGEGVEIHLRKYDSGSGWARMSSGILAAVQRALKDEGITLNYDPRLTGFSIALPEGNAVHAGPPRFQSFNQLAGAYHEVHTPDNLRSLFLGVLPRLPHRADEIIDRLKARVGRMSDESVPQFPADHPLMQELDKLKANPSPNVMLLLEFWDLYKDVVGIHVVCHDDEVARAAKKGGRVFEEDRALRYLADDGMGCSVDVSDYFTGRGRSGKPRLINLTPRDTVFNIFAGIALAYQEKVHDLKLPNAVAKGAPLTSAEIDLGAELKIRAHVLATRDLGDQTMAEQIAADLFDSELLPVAEGERRNLWSANLKVRFYQELRERFGGASRETIMADPYYLEAAGRYQRLTDADWPL